MKSQPVILIIGTVDTKNDEIAYLRERVEIAGGRAVIMDVGVLGCGGFTPDISNTEVAHAAEVSGLGGLAVNQNLLTGIG